MQRQKNLQAAAGVAVIMMMWTGAVRAVEATVAASDATAPVADSGSGSGLEEITVTARRKEESLQSVPISITAISAEGLREKSISSTEDLQMATPGVYLGGSGGRENVIYQIRGQSKALSGPSSPAVVSYFADVPDVTFGSSVPQYDISSIQVLKGPQGTLFGRNTTGGAVLYVPTAPSNDFGGEVSVTGGNYDDKEIEGAINLPIIDKIFAVRIAGDIHQRAGYTHNLAPTGTTLDNLDSKAGRVSLLFTPIEEVKNVTIVDYYRDDYDGDSVNLINVAPGPTLLAELGLQAPMAAQVALQRARGPFLVDTSGPDYSHSRRTGVTNRTDVDLGAVTLTNIFGYRDTHLDYYINVDGIPPVIADGTGAIPAGLPVEFIKGSLDSNFHQYSDEFQVKGRAFDGKLDWLGGLFYLTSKPSGPEGNFVGFAHVDLPGVAGTPTAYNFITETSKAVYVHGSYDLSDFLQGLSFEVGARYTWDDISSCLATGTNTFEGQVSPQDCANSAADTTGTSINSTRSGAPTASIGANWQIDPDLFVYVASRHGYRAGGINGPTFTGRLTEFQSFTPEKVTDVEVGMRSDWHMGSSTLRLNASPFIGWYSNVQTVLTGVQTAGNCVPGVVNAPGVSPDGDCNPANDPAGGTLIVNLGKTQVPGVDLDGVLAFRNGLSFTAAANFLSPKTSSVNIPASLAPYIPAGGLPFNLYAKRTFTGGARYALPLGPDVGTVVFNADEYYTSEVAVSGGYLPPYAVLNLRADLNDVAGLPVDVSLFMNNAANREYASAPVATGAFLGLSTAIYGPPRMYGMEIRYRFGHEAAK